MECPHLERVMGKVATLSTFPSLLTPVTDVFSCEECGDVNSAWLCVTCGAVNCGRFVTIIEGEKVGKKGESVYYVLVCGKH